MPSLQAYLQVSPLAALLDNLLDNPVPNLLGYQLVSPLASHLANLVVFPLVSLVDSLRAFPPANLVGNRAESRRAYPVDSQRLNQQQLLLALLLVDLPANLLENLLVSL